MHLPWVLRAQENYTLVHHSSGQLVESQDIHFDEGEPMEPSRVRIKMEISENKAGTEEIHADEVLDESKTDSDSSVDLQDHLDIKSDNDDDEDDPKGPPKRSGGSGSTGHSTSSSSGVDNTSKVFQPIQE